MMQGLLEVSTSDGKYTVIQEDSGRVHALRYGEEWRELTGDNLILRLAQELEATRELAKTIVVEHAGKFAEDDLLLVRIEVATDFESCRQLTKNIRAALPNRQVLIVSNSITLLPLKQKLYEVIMQVIDTDCANRYQKILGHLYAARIVDAVMGVLRG